jgi:hypothetical protein
MKRLVCKEKPEAEMLRVFCFYSLRYKFFVLTAIPGPIPAFTGSGRIVEKDMAIRYPKSKERRSSRVWQLRVAYLIFWGV